MSTKPLYSYPESIGRTGAFAGMQISARWFWLSCGALAVLAVWPLWTTLYPGMTDYPNHLARAQLIVDDLLHAREHPYYELRHVLIPNLALDTLVPLLVIGGLSVNEALKLFAAVALLLPVAGVIALARVLQGGTPWLALLAFPLAFSRYYAWGFLNYFFAIGLALLAFAGWLRLRQRQPMLAGLALALTGALTMMSHLMGFGVLALLVLSHEGWLVWRARHIAIRALVPTLLALVACAAFYLLAFERGLAPDVRWLDSPMRKLRHLVSPFIAYEVLPALVVATLVIGALLLARWKKHLVMQPGWLPPVAVFMVVFLLMPTVIMNSSFASARLFIVPVLVFLAFATLRSDARMQVAIALVAVLATAVKTVDVQEQWQRTSARHEQLREALQVLPEASRLATVVAVQRRDFIDVYPVRHAAAFAIVDRQAYIPNFFGFPFNGEAVAFKPEVQPLTRQLFKDFVVYQADEPVPWDTLCRHFDAVLVIEQGRRAALPGCARPLRMGEGFAIYRLVR